MTFLQTFFFFNLGAQRCFSFAVLGCFLPLITLSCSVFTDSDQIMYKPADGNADFIVDQVQGQVVATRVNGLPEEISITYKACFRDFIHHDNSLPNSVFKIHFFENFSRANGSSSLGASDVPADSANSNNAPVPPEDRACPESSSFLLSTDYAHSCIQVRTDAGGCLNWTEVYPYSPVSESVWFHYTRAFEGTGAVRGMAFIPMAVNPWLSLDPSGSAIQLQLVDLRYHSIDRPRRLISRDWSSGVAPGVPDERSRISECRACYTDPKDANCDICKKEASLSFVIARFAGQSARPRLWVDELNSNISQEHLFIHQQAEEEHSRTLKQFKVCHGDLREDCDPPGRFFKVRVELPLRIQVKNYRSEEELLPLTRGDYKLKAHLFLTTETAENIILHRDMGFVSSSLSRGTRQETVLTSEFYLHVPYENYGLRAFLGLRVEPGADSTFLPFEGVFSFPNRLRSVVGRNNLSLNKKRETLSFYAQDLPAGEERKASLIDSYKLSGSWLNTSAEGFRRAGWDVRLNRLRFSDVSVEEGECPTPVGRTVRYVGEVCIVDPLTNTVVPNTGITIQRQDIFFDRNQHSRQGEVVKVERADADLQKDIYKFVPGTRLNLEGEAVTEAEQAKDAGAYTSDTSGCLQWVDKLSHKWYNREKYFVRKMIFSKPEWGFEGERMIAINPWHWGFVFFQDVTQLGHSSIRTVPKGAERPQIVLHDFRSLFPEPIYTIDRWLGINLFQNLLFLFRVRVDRPDNISVGQGGQRPSAMDVRRGYYFLRFILVKSHTEESGGMGNLVVKSERFNKEYRTIQPWNINTGWSLSRDGNPTGQMMTTDLEYITHFDTYVQIRDSVVNAYINFLFDLDEFIFIGSNNRLIVQLLPTDPRYYKYYPETCEVDPKRSAFKPYIEHELIARPFMGTFVPSDQRNWNIFRVLDENVNLELRGKPSRVDRLNADPRQMEQFIKTGRETSVAHELFTKLNASLNVEAFYLSGRSSASIKDLSSYLKTVYDGIEDLLSAPVMGGEGRFSDFNQIRIKLVEHIDLALNEISTSLGDGTLRGEVRDLLAKLSPVLTTARSHLDSSALSPLELQAKMKEVREAVLERLGPVANLPQELMEQLTTVKPVRTDTEIKSGNKWFSPEITFPSDPDQWSARNRDLFARDEGLKVISMEDTELVSEFIQDLNDSAKIHNAYHEQWARTASEKDRSNMDWMQEQAELEQTKTACSAKEEEDCFLKQAGAYSNYRERFWDNFKEINSDDYYAIKEKTRQMYLPEMRSNWLNQVLVQGIYSRNLETPEVMTFLHSLCGFWFDKFYDRYLEREQIDVIFQKHLDHFRYYKSTLEYFTEEGAHEQYKDLYEAMVQYRINPDSINDPDSGLLSPQSPFLPYSSASSSADSPDGTGELPLTLSLYAGLDSVSKRASTLAGLANGGSLTSSGSDIYDSLVKAHRHPFFKCLANPRNFFHIEKKIVVGDIGSDYSDLQYKYGFTKSVNVQRAFDYAYSATWSMSRSFSASLGTGFTALGGLGDLGGGAGSRFINPLNLVNPVFAFNGVRLSSDWSTSRSESDANRRQQSLRFADESLYLQLNHSVISIRLKNFRHCLTVRAKNLAFNGYEKGTVWDPALEENFIYQIPYIKSGLMLCSEDMTASSDGVPFSIDEDYFYLYQLIPGDRGQFQNPLSFRNRPFVVSLRGVTEMEKFIFLIHAFVEADKVEGVEDYNPYGLMTNPYNTLSHPAEGIRQAVNRVQVWDKTGFYPGVYTVKYNWEHYLFSNPEEEEKGFFERIGEWLYHNNIAPPIRFDNSSAVYQRDVPQ